MSSVQQKLFEYKIPESGAVVGQEEMTGTLTKVMPEIDAPTIPKATIYQGERRLAR